MSDITDAGPRLKAMNDVLAENDRLRLTEAERGAMESVLDFCERTDKPLPTSDQIATLRGLLGKRPERDKAPAAGGNLPSGKDTPKTHANSEKFTERESVT